MNYGCQEEYDEAMSGQAQAEAEMDYEANKQLNQITKTMSEKLFCGNAKVITTKYGEMVKISFSKKDLQTMMDNLSEAGWINTVLKEKKDKVEGKPTHYLEVDTYKPTPANGLTNGKSEDSENLPF